MLTYYYINLLTYIRSIYSAVACFFTSLALHLYFLLLIKYCNTNDDDENKQNQSTDNRERGRDNSLSPYVTGSHDQPIAIYYCRARARAAHLLNMSIATLWRVIYLNCSLVNCVNEDDLDYYCTCKKVHSSRLTKIITFALRCIAFAHTLRSIMSQSRRLFFGLLCKSLHSIMHDAVDRANNASERGLRRRRRRRLH